MIASIYSIYLEVPLISVPLFLLLLFLSLVFTLLSVVRAGFIPADCVP